MRLQLLLTVAVLCASAIAAVDLNKPIAELPLADGRTLKNVTFVSYASSAIMAKWDGGRGTLAYDLLPEEVGRAAEKMRPRPSAANPARPPAATSTPQPKPNAVNSPVARATMRELSGQVFITTRGAGAYKISGTTVYLYPMEVYDMAAQTQRIRYSPIYPLELNQAIAWRKALEDHKPIASATTDADGMYRLSIPPSGEFFLYCDASRRVSNASEYYVWVLGATEGRIDLNLGNLWQQPR